MRVALFIYSLLLTVGIALAIPLLAVRRIFGKRRAFSRDSASGWDRCGHPSRRTSGHLVRSGCTAFRLVR